MKAKTILEMLLAFLLVAGFSACSDDDKENQKVLPLIFEKNTYEMSFRYILDIPILSGNGDYTLKVEKPEVLDAKVWTDKVKGEHLMLTGKQKGSTSVVVKDNVANETVTLNIKLTDGYLGLAVKNSNHPALENNVWVYLINNDSRECYFLQGSNEGHIPTSAILSRGTYSFSVEKDGDHLIPYLTLVYASDENGKFTEAAIAPTVHKYDINDNKAEVYTIIQQFLNVDWDMLSKDGRDVNRTFYLNMKEVGTEYEVNSTLETVCLPEGILK